MKNDVFASFPPHKSANTATIATSLTHSMVFLLSVWQIETLFMGMLGPEADVVRGPVLEKENIEPVCDQSIKANVS